MIIDDLDSLEALFRYIQGKKTLLVPIYTDHQKHVAVNNISCIYVYTEDGIERMVPIYHTEAIRGFSEHLSRFLELDGIYIHDKKNWLVNGGKTNTYDIKALWWYTYNEPYAESKYHTPSHKFYWSRHQLMEHVNAVIPIMNHYSMCQHIRKYAWPMIVNSDLSESYIHFNSIYPEVFAEIEKHGLCVTDEFDKPDIIQNGKIYSQYNYYTSTGRPSNRFAGFNFAAMDKSDGTRNTIIPCNDIFVEMDFDSYHLRLIASIIGIDLPETSVHQYLGEFYFGKTELTETEYEESKQLNFQLVYGHIPSEFLEIPYFKQVNEFTNELWNQYKKLGYITTPIGNRPIYVDNASATKVFNYYIQAVETEISVLKMQQVIEYLKDTKSTSKLVLYTYDSLLFDINMLEAKQLVFDIKEILTRGNFPVKIKYGTNYGELQEVKII